MVLVNLTEVLLLFIASMAATALAGVVKPISVADLDAMLEEVKQLRDTTTQRTGSSHCPTGWVKFGERCFSYYPGSMDWVSAENYCLNMDSNLVSIHSEIEYQLIKALIRAQDPEEKPTWIGLSCCQKRNKWMWSDGTKVTFTKWNPNEPSSDHECCAHMNWSDKKDWNDIVCESSHPFVCVKRPSSLAPSFPVQFSPVTFNWHQYSYTSKQ